MSAWGVKYINPKDYYTGLELAFRPVGLPSDGFQVLQFKRELRKPKPKRKLKRASLFDPNDEPIRKCHGIGCYKRLRNHNFRQHKYCSQACQRSVMARARYQGVVAKCAIAQALRWHFQKTCKEIELLMGVRAGTIYHWTEGDMTIKPWWQREQGPAIEVAQRLIQQ